MLLDLFCRQMMVIIIDFLDMGSDLSVLNAIFPTQHRQMESYFLLCQILQKKMEHYKQPSTLNGNFLCVLGLDFAGSG